MVRVQLLMMVVQEDGKLWMLSEAGGRGEVLLMQDEKEVQVGGRGSGLSCS